jgi:hypothetical protein
MMENHGYLSLTWQINGFLNLGKFMERGLRSKPHRDLDSGSMAKVIKLQGKATQV